MPQNAPPPPPLEFALLWDVPVPFCPEELAAAGSAQAELRQGRSRIGIHLADGTEAGGAPEARPAPPLAPADAEAIDRHPEFEGHTAVVGWSRWALFALPERRTLVAFNLEKDRLVWEFRAAAATVVAPQVIRGRVLLASLDNHLYCLRAQNGHQIWRARAAARLALPVTFWRDRVILAPEGAPYLESFHLRDGSPAGRFPLGPVDARVLTAPTVIEDVLLVAYARYGSTSCRLRAARLREGG